jgi:hypothetical protein
MLTVHQFLDQKVITLEWVAGVISDGFKAMDEMI